MAQLWCTGPAHIWVQANQFNPNGIVASGGKLYLGTAELSPQIQIIPKWRPVNADQGGDEPMDWSYQGKAAVTMADMARWNENVLQFILSVPNPLSVLGAGVESSADVGSLMGTEGLAWTCWVLFPFQAQKPAQSGQVAGYHFPFSFLEGPANYHQLGTKPKKVHLVARHFRAFFPATGQFRLYDFNMQGIPLVPGN